jgi:hypothetical protein
MFATTITTTENDRSCETRSATAGEVTSPGSIGV